MLSSYPVICPQARCGWMGNLVPSLLPGGGSAEIKPGERAWFRCPRCGGDWEVQIADDHVIVQPTVNAVG